MITAEHLATERSSVIRFAALRPSAISSARTGTARELNSTVIVAHSSPLVAAGLTTVLRRLEGCQVRVWDAMSEATVFAGAVIVLDDLALAAQLSTCTAVGAAAPKLVLLTNGTREVDRASVWFSHVRACLSIDCPEEELLGTVQGLLGDVPPAGWCSSVSTDAAVRRMPNCATASAGPRPTGGLAPGALRRVREYIEAGFTQKFDLEQLAVIAGLSASYFSRAFKQSVGMPPRQYVLMRRLAAAAELIRKTTKPLADVAMEVGFSDQSHFTRTFTQMIGETPGALRRRHR